MKRTIKQLTKYNISTVLSHYLFDTKTLEKIAERYKDNPVMWAGLCITQKLPESFMEKYASRLNWGCVCEYQQMSDRFILKHIDKIEVERLVKNKHLKGKLLPSTVLALVSRYPEYKDKLLKLEGKK
ncbi:MAG: hypothetical protein QXI58_01240 [Candidatus Micrarchaeia archaeon]